jgi:hypothetical protein
MLGLAWDWRRTVELAARVLKLKRFKKVAALVTLITSRIIIPAERACSLYETICQEALMCLAVWLCIGLLLQVSILV